MPPGDKDVFRTSDAHKIWGVRFAVVEGNEDPVGRGRVQISLPWLGSSVWALVASPPGVTSSKFQAGDQVVVAFESGDPSHPVVLGRVGS